MNHISWKPLSHDVVVDLLYHESKCGLYRIYFTRNKINPNSNKLVAYYKDTYLGNAINIVLVKAICEAHWRIGVRV